MSRSKFIRIYSSLPDDIRKEIIVVIDNKPYSWNAAYLEIERKTPLGEEILKKMKKMGLLENE